MASIFSLISPATKNTLGELGTVGSNQLISRVDRKGFLGLAGPWWTIRSHQLNKRKLLKGCAFRDARLFRARKRIPQVFTAEDYTEWNKKSFQYLWTRYTQQNLLHGNSKKFYITKDFFFQHSWYYYLLRIVIFQTVLRNGVHVL